MGCLKSLSLDRTISLKWSCVAVLIHLTSQKSTPTSINHVSFETFAKPFWNSSTSPVSMVTSSYTSRLWSQDLHPQNWTKYQVWEWLQQTLDMHQIDATSIPFQNFDLDGRQLCNMSFQDFTRAAGSVGSILFQSLTDLKWNGKMSCKTCSWINNVVGPGPTVLSNRHHIVTVGLKG